MNVTEILNEKLIGNAYTRFSVGDTFELYFDQFRLIAQSVTSADEKRLDELLSKEYLPMNDAIDREDIATSVVISSTLRKTVTAVSLKADSSLELAFENGVILQSPTDTDIVDWHWAINENGGDPYISHIICCFAPGEVQISTG